MKRPFMGTGWSVVLAGTGINLALGVLYTWSIFKAAILQSIESGGAFNWNLASINDPYAVCCIVFAFSMIPAGRFQDRYGPRRTAMLGGLLVGLGFLVVSQTTGYLPWVLGFGVLVGAGIAFGYSSATPPALKWFPPEKTGLIAGIVVSGFGLASVYIAPLAKTLLASWGLQSAMMFFGLAFFLVVCGFAMGLRNPRETVRPRGPAEKAMATEGSSDPGPLQIIRRFEFYLLWLAFLAGAGAGLMVIGSVAGMAKKSLGEYAFWVVVTVAVGNALGRIVAGWLSDRMGRRNTLIGMLVFQAALMFGAIPLVGADHTAPVLLVLLATGIGFNYGTNLALFPSFAKDLWGLRHFGTNYGVLFSAWGVGGFFMVRLSQTLVARSGSYETSFLTAGGLLLLGTCFTLLLKEHIPSPAPSAVSEPRSLAAGIPETPLPAVAENPVDDRPVPGRDP